MNGGSVTAYNAVHWLSGVADFGGYHANNILGTGVDGTLSTYLSVHEFAIAASRVTRLTGNFGVVHIGG
jgi:hypothetical protein